MQEPERLTHWSMPVRNLEESMEFYRDFLGLQYRGPVGNNRGACFRVGNEDFICWETGYDSDPHALDAGVHYAFTFSPDAWDQAVIAVHKRGVPLNRPIIYREKGTFTGRELYILDPSKNEIEFTDPTWKPGMPTPTFEEITAAAPVGP